MSRKKYQAQIIDEKEEDEEQKNSMMTLPEDNVFNIESKSINPKQSNKNNDDSTSMEKHHKFSKFKKIKGT